MDVRFFDTPADLRCWFEENHATAQELWIGFYKASASKSAATYKQALDEALCFGWIDGIRRSIDSDSYTNRFTPRKPRSNWSDVNIKRIGELMGLGLVHPAGLAAFERRTEERSRVYTYEQTELTLDAGYAAQLRANSKAWAFFQAQAPWYQRTSSRWVMSAKREETRLKRLATLIEDSEHGRRIGLLTRPPRSE